MAIEIKIVTAIFNPDSATANAYGLWQWDYGQVLRIQGLHLPSMVEIHFSLQDTGGTSVMRVGITKDGVTDVVIPDSMLQNNGAASDYDIFAFVYLTDDTSGQTEYKIKLRVKSRPEPEVPSGGEDPNIFREAVQAVKKSADKASESERQAEGWAHGREDLPERAEDNAKYYAGQTAADAKKTGTDRKEVERLAESVSDIDQQVTKVENLTKQAQTSTTNAALSEQAAKTAETNAQNAQAGAEIAEGNAELAEQGAKASKQVAEKAKQLVTQMGQEVLNNKNHVDQTVQAFTLTAQQAVADVNKAGQTQTERVQSVGNTAVESVKTAQNTATKAVEEAKAEAIEAVQTEGTTQTGNVTAEGTKQVQAVQQAAQEIVADRKQIQQNKADVTTLKKDLAQVLTEEIQTTNLLYLEDGTLTKYGVTITVNDGYIKLSGKSTTNGHFKISNGLQGLTSITDWFSEQVEGFSSGDSATFFYVLKKGTDLPTFVRIYDNDTNDWVNITETSTTKNINKAVSFVDIYCKNGETVDCTIGIQIEKGTVAHDFVNCNDTDKSFNPSLKSARLDEIEKSIKSIKIVVDKNGNGDYSTVQEAVDNAIDGSEILVMPGEYEEAVDLGTKALHLHGLNASNTIIWNDTGAYDTPPLEVGHGLIENLSFYSKKDLNKDYSEITRKPYAVHLDQRWGTGDKSVVFKNCVFIGEHTTPIGCGVVDDVNIELYDCLADATTLNNGNAFQIHGDGKGTGNANITISNCTFKKGNTGNGNGILLSNGGASYNTGTTITIKANNCYGSFYNNIGDLLILDSSSFGNSDKGLNSV